MELQPVVSRAVWEPADLRADRSWVFTLDDTHIRELREALAHFRARANARGLQSQWQDNRLVPEAAEFPLPTLGPALDRVQRQLERDFGVCLVRNFPLDGGEEEARLMFGGLLSHIGRPQPQTIQGELLQVVQDEGQASLDERRGSKHNLGLPIHNDGCDVVGFLCRQTPAHGGTTILVSAAHVHNALLEDAPELLQHLYRPYHSAWQDYMFPGYRNSPASGLPRTWAAPIFSVRDRQLCCRYSRFYIDRAQDFPGVPAMSRGQVAALDALDSLLGDVERFQFRRQFEAGDILLLNNHVVLHSRTHFVDGAGDRRRQLYRAWMAVPNSRPLAESMACFFTNVEAGAVRGGVKPEFMLADAARSPAGAAG